MLGLWLLSGINRVQASLFGILAFASLAVVSGRMVVLGVRDCGCLGTLPTSPWVMCGLDVLLAIGLGLSLYHGTDRAILRQGLRQLFVSTFGIAAVIAVLATVLLGRYGSIHAAVQHWTGHPLGVPSAVDAIPDEDYGTARASIPVRNAGDAPIRLVGSDACCGARVQTPLPRSLDPGESDTLIVTMNCSRRPSLAVTLWVESDGRLKKQRVVVSCRTGD